MKKHTAIKINENHRRIISVRLSLLDEMLCEFEEIANKSERGGVMYIQQNTLSARQCSQLKSIISEMRRIIFQMKEVLGLRERKEDLASRIWSEASSLWEVLVETESKYLKGYGELSDNLAEFLDPKIKKITEYLTEIVKITGKEGKSQENIKS